LLIKPLTYPLTRLLLILLVFGVAFLQFSRRAPETVFASTLEQFPSALVDAQLPNKQLPDAKLADAKLLAPARFESGFLPNPKSRQSHAASMVALSNGRIRAFWLDGEEGSFEAVISSSLFDPQTARWSEPVAVTDAATTESNVLRHVRKVGNMVAHRAQNGTLWLFYVTVSVGGWGGSSISYRTSGNDGITWSSARRLITAPFMNFSTLLRHAPVALADGTIGLPLYHEFLNMYSEWVRIDATGKIIDRQRLNDRFVAIQPQFLVKTATEALVLMRNAGSVQPRKVIQTSTRDAGQQWSAASESALPNPGSPVSGVVLADGRLLIARNNTDSRRKVLSLALSADGGVRWRTVHLLEDQSKYGLVRVDPPVFMDALRESAMAAGETAAQAQQAAEFAARVRCNDQGKGSCDFEFSYPFVTRSSDGDFFVLYTWNRAQIRWLRFNQSWLEQRWRESADLAAH
jgi:predicted neuraminidase